MAAAAWSVLHLWRNWSHLELETCSRGQLVSPAAPAMPARGSRVSWGCFMLWHSLLHPGAEVQDEPLKPGGSHPWGKAPLVFHFLLCGADVVPPEAPRRRQKAQQSHSE